MKAVFCGNMPAILTESDGEVIALGDAVAFYNTAGDYQRERHYLEHIAGAIVQSAIGGQSEETQQRILPFTYVGFTVLSCLNALAGDHPDEFVRQQASELVDEFVASNPAVLPSALYPV